MDVETFLLCDAANDSQGKLNILGAFNTIGAGQVPIVKPSAALACRLRFELDEVGEHHFEVNVIDMDGRNIIKPIEGNLKVAIASNQLFSVVNIILNIQNLKLEQFGHYRIELRCMDKVVCSLPFSLTKVEVNQAM